MEYSVILIKVAMSLGCSIASASLAIYLIKMWFGHKPSFKDTKFLIPGVIWTAVTLILNFSLQSNPIFTTTVSEPTWYEIAITSTVTLLLVSLYFLKINTGALAND